MSKTYRVVNVNNNMQRVVVLIMDQKDMYFGVIILRASIKNPQRFCVYRGLTHEEYTLLAKNPETEESYSFFGVSDPKLNVPKEVADSFLQDQPMFFVGHHYDSTEPLACMEDLDKRVTATLESTNAR